MPSSAISVVEEFLRSMDAQQRRNAATALAVIADDEAIAHLVSVALSDSDDSVRKRAEFELLTLEEGIRNLAIERLEQALKDPSRRQTAYGILGRFRSQGIVQAAPRASLLARFQLAIRQSRYLYPKRNWLSRLRAWKPGLIGGLIGVAILVVFFFRTWWREDIEGFTVASIAILVIAPVLAIFVTLRTNPFNLYPDRRVALLVESLNALFFSLICSLSLLIIYFVLNRFSMYRDLGIVLGLLLTFSVLTGIVRVGTVISLGLFPGRRLNRVGQVIVGLATGFVFLALFNLIAWKLGLKSIITSVLWVGSLPMCIVMANSFAAVDTESIPTKPIKGRLSYIFSLLVLLPSLAVTLLALFTGHGIFQRRAPNLDLVFDEIASKESLVDRANGGGSDDSYTVTNTNTSTVTANTNTSRFLEAYELVGGSWNYYDSDGESHDLEFLRDGTLIVIYPEGSDQRVKAGTWKIGGAIVYLEYGTVKSQGRVDSNGEISGVGRSQGHSFDWRARKY